jgi:N-acyl-D-amino-acid deacylase
MRRFIPMLLLLITLGALRGQSAPQEAAAGPASILIAGGTVVDGTGAKGRHADVRIVGDTIAEIGKLKPRPGESVISARGQIIAPGFIDTHSHADGGLLESPTAETQIRQGITTSIVGQDGGSHLPLAAWFAEVRKTHVALNIASFVGHGTVRSAATGKDYKRPVTPAELTKMEALVEQEMQSGALGLSSGLEYDPGYYSTTEELIALARVAGQHGGLYISHVRDEGNEALTSFRELIRIAEEAHLPAQISHIKLGTSHVWGKAPQVLQMMEEANRRGVDISADVYPYLYWQSTLTVLTLDRNWENRAIWEKGLAEVGGAGHVLLSSYTPDAAWQGKTIAQIAAMTGRDPISVIQEIVRKTHGEGVTARESVVVTAMTDDDLKQFIASPRIMFCTDGGLRGTHPRGAGSYPRILGHYVRALKVIPLEEAIRKMTSLPARRMSIPDRGALQVGKKADIVIFDAGKVLDKATTANPTAPPVGLSTVLVNGVPVLEAGKMTGARPGMVLRRTAEGVKAL